MRAGNFTQGQEGLSKTGRCSDGKNGSKGLGRGGNLTQRSEGVCALSNKWCQQTRRAEFDTQGTELCLKCKNADQGEMGFI